MNRSVRQIRPDELNARGLNDVLRDVQARLSALERVQWTDVQIVTNAGGTASPVVIALPSWPVSGVFLARAWNATAGAPFSAARFGWELNANGIVVTIASADLAVSTTYQFRFKVEG